MPPLEKIAILLHENDPYPRLDSHLVWSLRPAWEAEGIEVEVVKGIARQVDTDLLFSHLAMSEVPVDYEAYRRQYPRVINGAVRDITKRHVSRNLVAPDDAYDGPVIVKTNRNYGGLPEYLLRQERLSGRPLGRLRSAWHRFVEHNARRSLRTACSLCVDQYPIFDAVAEVPPAVFANESLVVERFLPEREGELYCLRLYVFLGDRHFSIKAKSTMPIAKGQTMVSREVVEVPEAILALRRDLGFDYGKFDYVLRDGEVVLLDANSTPGRPPHRVEGSPTSMPEVLAAGIHALCR